MSVFVHMTTTCIKQRSRTNEPRDTQSECIRSEAAFDQLTCPRDHLAFTFICPALLCWYGICVTEYVLGMSQFLDFNLDSDEEFEESSLQGKKGLFFFIGLGQILKRLK